MKNWKHHALCSQPSCWMCVELAFCQPTPWCSFELSRQSASKKPTMCHKNNRHAVCLQRVIISLWAQEETDRTCFNWQSHWLSSLNASQKTKMYWMGVCKNICLICILSHSKLSVSKSFVQESDKTQFGSLHTFLVIPSCSLQKIKPRDSHSELCLNRVLAKTLCH